MTKNTSGEQKNVQEITIVLFRLLYVCLFAAFLVHQIKAVDYSSVVWACLLTHREAGHDDGRRGIMMGGGDSWWTANIRRVRLHRR